MIGSPPPTDPTEVLKRVRGIARRLSTHVNTGGRSRVPSPSDPVRRKNLERIAGQLQDVIAILDAPFAAPRGPEGLEGLSAVLDRLERPEALTMNGAWEVADTLEIELIRMSEPARVLVLLESYETKRAAEWRARFPEAELTKLLTAFRAGQVPPETLERAREMLVELEKIRVNGFRRDRALMEQKGQYLRRMSLVLLLMLVAFGAMLATTVPNSSVQAREDAEAAGQNEPAEATPDARDKATADTTPPRSDAGGTTGAGATDTIATDTTAADTTTTDTTATDTTRGTAGTNTIAARDQKGRTGAAPDSAATKRERRTDPPVWRLLILSALAGAVGSILSRAIRLGGRQAFAIGRNPDDSVPLGIRAQLAAWQLFFSQVAVGTTAGVLLYVILLSNLLEVANINPTNALHASVIALLAGFSERLFIGKLDELVNQSSGGAGEEGRGERPQRPEPPIEEPVTSPPP